ncbi:MAG: hypothetical protein GQ534_04570, partial [Candidatus Delongbacteria bacterium]|nr:hypothetical protein [Candidatus Delongbacteria bacterium]
MSKQFYFMLLVFLIRVSLFATDGFPGHTINLDGGECVEVPYSTDLNPAQFTVSFWAKVEDGVGTFRSPITSRSSTTGYMFYASDDDHWEFWTRNGSTSSMKIEGPLVVMNKWTHIAGTYDGTKMTFYVDGTFAGEFWGSSFVPNSQYPLRIGAGNTESTPDYFFYGDIDEVSLWNYAKTVDEVREGMHNTFSGLETGLVSYWQFNDELIDSAGDNHGNSHLLEFPDDMIVSDVLVGSGASDHYIFVEPASTDFIGTNIAMNITTETGIDSILVARIERNPNVIPDGFDATYAYWVFREYGSGTYTADVMFTFDSDIPDTYSGKNSYFKLYRRDIDSIGEWIYVSEPYILSTQDNYMIFSDLNLNSQYMISYNKLPQISTAQLPITYTFSDTFSTGNIRAVTTAADIDNDGNLDILVGSSDGTISHYEADMFDPENFSLVTENFCGIDVGTYSAPTFVDLDSDGTLDLVIGSGDGQLYKYSQNIVAPEIFTYSQMLKDNLFNTIDIGSSSAPVFCDLNDDGLLDLYIGCSSTDVIYVSEQITGNIFSDPFPITKGNGSYQKPNIGDIDNDGLLDMLIGNSAGTISHYEQTTPTSGFSFLVLDNYNNLDVGTYSAPFLYDVSGNGFENILIGDNIGNINYFKQISCDSLDFGEILLGGVVTKNYLMKAVDLSNDLNITCPAGYSISLSGTGYTQNLSIVPVNGSVSDTVFVKFEPTIVQQYTGNISHTSTDMETKLIVLTGKVNELLISETYPNDNGIDIPLNYDLKIIFDGNVTAGSGNVTLFTSLNDSIVETISATSCIVTDSLVTINPTNDFELATDYYVLVDSTAFMRTDSAYFDGIINIDAWDFTSLGYFTEISAGLLGVIGGSTEWADYDNDGDLDVLITGATATGRHSAVYSNTNGVFTDINAGLEDVSNGSAVWGDYDNDGYLDIALSGESDSGEVTYIYRNDAGTFTNINAGCEGGNIVIWGDYDNDGDLDLFLTGHFGTGESYSFIYTNNVGIFTRTDNFYG